jgi:uncharacterized protein (TIGR03000 family)
VHSNQFHNNQFHNGNRVIIVGGGFGGFYGGYGGYYGGYGGYGSGYADPYYSGLSYGGAGYGAPGYGYNGPSTYVIPVPYQSPYPGPNSVPPMVPPDPEPLPLPKPQTQPQTQPQPTDVVTVSGWRPGTITVLTNEGATVTFDGIDTKETGSRHSFTTKPIQPNAEIWVKIKVDGPGGSASVAVGLRGGEKATVDMRK